MQLLFRGFLFRIIFTGANFLAGLLIAKLAGAGQFGILSLMIVNAAVLQIITGLGTDAAIVWHGISGKFDDRNKIFSIAVFTALIQMFLFVVIASLFYALTAKCLLTGSRNMNLFYTELLYFSGLVFVEKFSAVFYSWQHASLGNKILALTSIILLILLFICWIFEPWVIVTEPVWIFSLYVSIPAVILIFACLKKFRPIIRSFGRNELRSFVNFSTIVFFTNLVQFIAYRADYWFIDFFHQKTDVGIYAQATKFAQLLWIIPGILAGLLVPALKNEKQKIENPGFLSICRIVFFIHIVIAIFLVAVAIFLYTYFLPVDYSTGFTSLLLMLPGYIFFTITTMLAAWFSANRYLKINLLGSIICLLTIAISDRLLIPAMNFKGAAIANLIAYSGTTFFFILLSLPYLKAGWKDFFIPRQSDFKTLYNNIFSPAANHVA